MNQLGLEAADLGACNPKGHLVFLGVSTPAGSYGAGPMRCSPHTAQPDRASGGLSLFVIYGSLSEAPPVQTRPLV